MKILAFLISDKAIIDSNKKLTIEGIFNTITADKFPAKHPELTITVITERESEKELGYRIYLEKDGQEITSIKDTVLAGQRHYLIGKFSDIIFKGSGTYTVGAEIDGEKITSNLYLKLTE